MPAYVVAVVNVTNPDAYAQYAKLAGIANDQYGSRFLARGGKFEVMEGRFAANRIVIAEFASMEKAKQFYNSPEYQAAREKRIGAADFNLVIVEGVG